MTTLQDGTAIGSAPDGNPPARLCSRAACGEEAVLTLTFDYQDAMAVVGPLSIRREPHSYDLCARHSERVSAPVGWQVVRHQLLTAD